MHYIVKCFAIVNKTSIQFVPLFHKFIYHVMQNKDVVNSTLAETILRFNINSVILSP